MKKATRILSVLTLLFTLFAGLAFGARDVMADDNNGTAPAATTAQVTLHKMKMTSLPDSLIQNIGQEMPGFGGYQYYTEGAEFKVYDVTAEFYAHRALNNSVDDSIAHVQGLTPSTTPVATVTTGNDGKVNFTLNETSGGKHAVYLFVETEKAGVTKAANMVLSFPVYALDENGKYTNTKLDHIHLYPKNEVDADGSLLVSKEGTANNEAINGAKFIVKDVTTNRFLSGFADGLFTWTTDEASAFEFVTGNIYQGLGAAITSTTGTEGHLEINGFEPGSYLLIETEAPANVAIIDASKETPFTITADQQASTQLTVMNDTILVDKDIVGDKRDYKVGDLIPYAIKVNIPEGMGDKLSNGDYKHPSMTITDAPDAGLQFNNIVEIKAGDTIIPLSDVTLADSGNGFVLTIPASALAAYKGKMLEITYDMFLDENADPDVGYNNKATVHTTETELTTEDSSDDVFTGGYKFKKVDANFGENNTLADAEFVVRDADDDDTNYLHINPATNAVTWVTSLAEATVFKTEADGLINVAGLEYGTYFLEEIKAPADYVLLEERVPFTVAKGSYTENLRLDVTNIRKGRLPSTGGSGIYGILGIGVVLVATTGGYYVKRRREA